MAHRRNSFDGSYIPRQPVQPANVWRSSENPVSPLLNLLETDANVDTLSEANAEFWKNKVKLDMSQFNDFRDQLNKSLTLGHPTSNSLFDNGSFLPQAPKGTSDKMPLVPRTPVVGLADNNKA